MALLSYKGLISQRLAEADYFYLLRDLKLKDGVLMKGTRISEITLFDCDKDGTCELGLVLYDNIVHCVTVHIHAFEFSKYFQKDLELTEIADAIILEDRNMRTKRTQLQFLSFLLIPVVSAVFAWLSIFMFSLQFPDSDDVTRILIYLVNLGIAMVLFVVLALNKKSMQAFLDLLTAKDNRYLESLRSTLTEKGLTLNDSATLDLAENLTAEESEQRLRQFFSTGTTQKATKSGIKDVQEG